MTERDQLIEEWREVALRLARSYCRGLHPSYDPAGFEEAALISLVRSADRWLEKRGPASFKTYFHLRLINALRREKAVQYPSGRVRYEQITRERRPVEARDAFALSLDAPRRSGSMRPLGDCVPYPDGEFLPALLDRLEAAQIERLWSLLTPSFRRVLIARYVEGLSAKASAAQLGIPQTTLTRWETEALSRLRQRLGVPPPPKLRANQKLDSAAVQRLLLRYERGEGGKALGNAFGINASSVFRLVKAARSQAEVGGRP